MPGNGVKGTDLKIGRYKGPPSEDGGYSNLQGRAGETPGTARRPALLNGGVKPPLQEVP